MIRLWLVLLAPILALALIWWAIKYVWCVLFAPQKAWTLAVSADQLANAAFNGDPDETISSRAGRHSLYNDKECWAVVLCWLLDKIQKDHCKNSLGV